MGSIQTERTTAGIGAAIGDVIDWTSESAENIPMPPWWAGVPIGTFIVLHGLFEALPLSAAGNLTEGDFVSAFSTVGGVSGVVALFAASQQLSRSNRDRFHILETIPATVGLTATAFVATWFLTDPRINPATGLLEGMGRLPE